MIQGQPNSRQFVVGIGTSAGGLIALEEFFSHVPPNSGFVYVVVQHLDPTKKALLPELLQRVTTMTVQSARHNEVLKPDHVYVIPPNRELTLQHGKLYLAPPTEVGGLRLPVDVLFHSLAQEYAEKAVGVVLSGMGSDGALGLQAIKRGEITVQFRRWKRATATGWPATASRRRWRCSTHAAGASSRSAGSRSTTTARAA